MPNGEQLTGTVIEETAETVVFRSDSFGELRIARRPGVVLSRGESAPAPIAATPAAVPPAAVSPAISAPPAPPPRKPSWIAQTLGLSDRWSLELGANLAFLDSEYQLRDHGYEATLGYKIPRANNPALTRHEYGLFGSYSLQTVNGTKVEEKSEAVARYFFLPDGRWIFISQADWAQDRFNSVEFSSNLIAVPAYKVVDHERTRLLVGVGPSWRIESRIMTTPQGTTFLRDENTFRSTLYQVFQHRFSPQLSFRETLLVMNPPEDFSTYSLRFQASLRRMLTDHLSLNLNYDYVRDQNDRFPLQSVSTLMLMLGYEL